jgi:hypothetical protein
MITPKRKLELIDIYYGKEQHKRMTSSEHNWVRESLIFVSFECVNKLKCNIKQGIRTSTINKILQ